MNLYCVQAETFETGNALLGLSCPKVIGYVLESNKKKAIEEADRKLMEKTGGFAGLTIKRIPKEKKDEFKIAIDEKRFEDAEDIIKNLKKGETK